MVDTVGKTATFDWKSIQLISVIERERDIYIYAYIYTSVHDIHDDLRKCMHYRILKLFDT